MERQFIVTLEIPKGVSVDEMTDYIETAVAVFKGGGDYEAPIYDLNGRTVRVKAVPKKRKVKGDGP